MCFMLSIQLTIFLMLSKKSTADNYNLFGEAGQAYSIEISIGHPSQKLNVIVDTGSATLAIASNPQLDSDKFFHVKNSSTVYESGQEIQAKYSQGTWVGKLVSDYVKFSSMPWVPEVRSDIALITKSHKFFMNGSGWQGLLGLAYLPVGAWGDNIIVGSWLDSIDHMYKKPISFELKLCGAQSVNNATHYGNISILRNENVTKNNSYIYHTPILKKRWFVVGVISVRVLSSSVSPAVLLESKTGSDIDMINETSKKKVEFNHEICQRLNEQKSIVDSGTTNIRLPDDLFTKVVNEIRNVAQTSNILILDEFWYRGEAACWPEPQQWSLPRLAIDMLDADAENQYFTLDIPPQNYMRVVSARNNSGESGVVSEFCYKLGLEAGGKETVLGYTAMEGLEIVFNRSAGWIGWRTSNCGPDVRIHGPFNTSSSLLVQCKLIEPTSDAALSIKAAQWTLFIISIVALAVLVYLLAPCVKMLIMKPVTRSPQISLSQTALVDQET